MTPLAELIGNLAGALSGAAPAGPSQRAGALVMPVQTAENSAALAANSSYSLPFSPGFEEGPEWPVEAWILGSFQVNLTGTVVVPLELELTPENEALPIVLSLVQHGYPVWSQNISLRLIPELGSEKRVFKFQTGVFVDLVNPLRYEAGAQPFFQVSGLVPIYAPPVPTVEQQSLERLTQMLAVMQEQEATQAEIVAAVEASTSSIGEAVTALEAAGITDVEMLAVLEEIAENTKP